MSLRFRKEVQEVLRKKRFVTAVLIVLGIIFLGYYAFLQMHGMDFSVIWLAGGILLVLSGAVLLRPPLWAASLPRVVKAGACILVFMGVLLFAALEVLILHGMDNGRQQDLDYIIVLGAQVRGDRPSRALRKRIETAAGYLRENPSTKAVLSGGQGAGENMTEAECMRKALVKAGIDGKRLILEERSASTRENLEYCAKIAPVKTSKTGLVTQDFHVYRSMKLARHQKYAYVYGIAAPSEPICQPHFMVREAFALMKEKLMGNL